MIKELIAGLGLLALVGCTTAPTTTPTPTGTGTDVGNTACSVYNTLSWALPLVESLAFSGQITSAEQAIIDDAKKVIDAGCNSSDASLLARANAAAVALVALLWA